MIASVWAEYRELITDPAHILLEATIVLLIDGLLLGAAVPFIKRWIKRHDREAHGQEVCQ